MNKQQMEIFKQDAVTKAVDECNKILAKVDHKIHTLKSTLQNPLTKYRVLKHSNKIVTRETYTKINKL